jgi:hypothetical protein
LPEPALTGDKLVDVAGNVDGPRGGGLGEESEVLRLVAGGGGLDREAGWGVWSLDGRMESGVGNRGLDG